MKIPSTNIQAPEKFQTPSFTAEDRRLGLVVEVLSFSGAWCLEFGVFDL
jgi:hypothetical protein